MSRVKAGRAKHARHKKVLNLTKGFRMTKNRLFKVANEAALHAGSYAFHGRKRRKRDFRSLWITRINAALRALNPDYSYSTFMASMKKAGIGLDRKILSELAANDSKVFESIIKKAL